MEKLNKSLAKISLNNKLIDGKYSKNSFYRFGDDLCELLLSYLTLEDKFRFECVSKK
jgi:hypothetical protein